MPASGGTAQPCLLAFTKRGILWHCHVNGLILHPRKVAASLSPPGPGPCLPGSEPLAPWVWGPPGFRGAEGAVCWLWLRPVLETQRPNLKVCPPTRSALLSPCGSSDVKFCCWGNVIGREPVETGLSVKSGNGRIWKHLAVCTDGGAVAHKRLVFRVNLPNPFCPSNLCLVHMTFPPLYACVVLGLLQK